MADIVFQKFIERSKSIALMLINFGHKVARSSS